MGSAASAAGEGSEAAESSFTQDSFAVLVQEFERRARSIVDDDSELEVMRQMRTVLNTLMHGEEVVDDRTYREKLSDEEYADKRSEIIANVLRWQAFKAHNPAETRGEGEDYVVDGKKYNTAEDAKEERMYTSALFGDEEDARQMHDANKGFEVVSSAEEASERQGKWEKHNAEGSGGMAFYLNRDSLEVCFLRPDTVDEEQEKAAQAQMEAEIESGVKRVHILKMPDEIDAIIKEGKTPLIIDTGSNQDNPQVAAFYSYNGILLDCKPLGLGFGKTGVKTGDILERIRKQVVGACKAGNQTLAIDVGSCCPDFASILKTKKNSAMLPLQVFQQGKMDKGMHLRKLYTEDDRDPPGPTGRLVMKGGIKVVVVCSYTMQEYEKELEGKIPMQHLTPIEVYSRS